MLGVFSKKKKRERCWVCGTRGFQPTLDGVAQLMNFSLRSSCKPSATMSLFYFFAKTAEPYSKA